MHTHAHTCTHTHTHTHTLCVTVTVKPAVLSLLCDKWVDRLIRATLFTQPVKPQNTYQCLGAVMKHNLRQNINESGSTRTLNDKEPIEPNTADKALKRSYSMATQQPLSSASQTLLNSLSRLPRRYSMATQQPLQCFSCPGGS